MISNTKDDAGQSSNFERDPDIKKMVEQAFRSRDVPSGSSKFAVNFTFEVTSDRREQLQNERSAAFERLYKK